MTIYTLDFDPNFDPIKFHFFNLTKNHHSIFSGDKNQNILDIVVFGGLPGIRYEPYLGGKANGQTSYKP